MADTERQFRWTLICGIDVALMSTDSWHCWGYTDHQCSDDHCQCDSS
ncbi:unnamed protein product [Staurois parvus]|uniref:Uncharacterized protein n=1 Tax=Staurois parvus TaxID=386267 RepID=A0ABN9HJZ0_9NEOB|nr:unnamed protein product [Staurois parvus]